MPTDEIVGRAGIMPEPLQLAAGDEQRRHEPANTATQNASMGMPPMRKRTGYI
jgi:hypothetical protein